MKAIKAVFLTVVITLIVLLIEPIRFFAGMAGFVIFGMLVVDTIKEYRKTQKEKVNVRKSEVMDRDKSSKEFIKHF